MAKQAGVRRYVLASSCSIYDFQDNVVDETSGINPLTIYAVANRRAEEAAFALASECFTVTACMAHRGGCGSTSPSTG